MNIEDNKSRQFENAKLTSQELLSEDGQLTSVAITEYAVTALPNDRDEKRKARHEMAKHPWCIFVDDTWTTIVITGARREAIMICLMESGKITRAEQCFYRRDKEGKIYFEEWLNLTGAGLTPVMPSNLS